MQNNDKCKCSHPRGHKTILQLGSSVDVEINSHHMKLHWNYTVTGHKHSNLMQRGSFTLFCRMLMSNVMQKSAPTIFPCLVIMKTTFG